MFYDWNGNMDSGLSSVELLLGYILGLAAILTLLVALIGLVRSRRRAIGRVSGSANALLKLPFTIVATVVFIGIGALIWRPLPLKMPPDLRIVMLAMGSSALLGGLVLYLWGFLTLGRMFGGASGFAARLYSDHKLIARGPFAFVRHPMYLAIIVAFMGGLLVYRTWTMLMYAALMLFLPFRASREEKLLVCPAIWKRMGRVQACGANDDAKGIQKEKEHLTNRCS
jgi:protein-S-isoprenylcysteine O-methyltransferase Ste14